MSDRGSWSAAELAEVLALEERAVSGALRKLKAAGLVQESSKGRFKSRRAGKFYTFPGRLPGMRVPFKAVRAYWERMFRRKGKEMADRVELVRASEGSVRGYVSGLFEALDAANTLATMEKGEDTGLFLIEAQVRKLTPL